MMGPNLPSLLSTLPPVLGTLAVQVGEPEMGMASWLFLGLAWTGVISLLVWSFVRVLWGPKPGQSS
jgi:hypothetical protein